MKTGGDNCILTSNVLNFETEELLVGSKVCPGIIMSLLKNVSTVSRNQKNKTLRPTIGNFRSEYEYDYEYEFSVLSTRTLKNVGLET